eukprot:gb/GECG01011852.1/.p1 GENE.gb/GECG01011852.1/~~gb/GECG01011852.1/.p1  ORF type:complete len:177 (+),score=16.62 gb/GECG01011852.1/:1-531(+)
MKCSFLWKDRGYAASDHISLDANETFEGCSGDGNVIDFSGIDNFEGLFTMQDSVGSLDEAPKIRSVAAKNGKSAKLGGFIVEKDQRYFAVDLCSSSGSIADGGGGICGAYCGRDNGEIKISNSDSAGRVMGVSSGGITGRRAGFNSGIVHITRCYSTGVIEEKVDRWCMWSGCWSS